MLFNGEIRKKQPENCSKSGKPPQITDTGNLDINMNEFVAPGGRKNTTEKQHLSVKVHILIPSKRSQVGKSLFQIYNKQF